MTVVTGIHHVTAMAGAPQANLDFYTRVLGLRFVKRTVNFDDPGTYHFYYGDTTGTPGTILTFFPWGADSLRGRIGTGQVSVTAFSIPAGAMDYWVERLARLDIAFDGPSWRFGEAVLSLRDPDGLVLDLVATDADTRAGWTGGDVPAAHAVRGFHHATLSLANSEHTVRVLTDTLGFRMVNEAADRTRLGAGDAAPGALIDLMREPARMRGTMGIGVVHHIAFRATTPADQLALRDAIAAADLHVTDVLDRQYFRSIYFREPGGVLFEVATDAPGFTTDEPVAELGLHLKLPPWVEDHRREIEAHVAPITVPATNNPGVQ